MLQSKLFPQKLADSYQEGKMRVPEKQKTEISMKFIVHAKKQTNNNNNNKKNEDGFLAIMFLSHATNTASCIPW